MCVTGVQYGEFRHQNSHSSMRPRHCKASEALQRMSWFRRLIWLKAEAKIQPQSERVLGFVPENGGFIWPF